jgi:hypothetical protein
MRRLCLRSAVGVVACIALLAADLAGLIASQQTNTVDDEWASALTAFVTHDAGAQAALIKKADTAVSPHVKTLAKRLLLEWDISQHRESLSRPRPIHVPRMQPGSSIVTAEFFMLIVEVDETGLVRQASFARPPGQASLGSEVLAKVKASLFRPAFKGGRFVAGQADLEYSIEVK